MVVTKGTRKQGRGVGRMSSRTAFWLAWSLCAVCVALIGLALLLDFLTDTSVIHAGYFQSAYEARGLLPGDAHPSLTVITGVLSLAYPMVGALIASRLPTNPIGWIFCGVGLLYTGQRFTIAYADYALLENLAFPGGEFMAWFSTLAAYKGTVLAGVFLMLLFPDGHLLSRRWQIVAWMAVLGAALRVIYDVFSPGSLSAYGYLENPFAVVGYVPGFPTYDHFTLATLVGRTLLLMGILAALFSLVLRLRRSRGEERQQIKWVLYAAVPAGVCFSYTLLYYAVIDFTELYWFGQPLLQWWESWGFFNDDIIYVAKFSSLVIPVFTYIAILRYHLYDIDVVINRTLVYGALSACVVGIYVLTV